MKSIDYQLQVSSSVSSAYQAIGQTISICLIPNEYFIRLEHIKQVSVEVGYE